MGKEKEKYLSSRYKTEICSRLGENTVYDYGILFTTVIFVGSMYQVFTVK